MRRPLFAVSVVVVAGVLVSLAAGGSEVGDGARARWVVRDLTPKGSHDSRAADVNGRGEVVGYSAFAEDRAARWVSGTMRVLDTSAITRSVAVAINERGEVVGTGGCVGGRTRFCG